MNTTYSLELVFQKLCESNLTEVDWISGISLVASLGMFLASIYSSET